MDFIISYTVKKAPVTPRRRPIQVRETGACLTQEKPLKHSLGGIQFACHVFDLSGKLVLKYNLQIKRYSGRIF